MSATLLAQLVKSAGTGDIKAREQLFVTLYNELHRMAERQLRGNVAMTLSPTTLLHETYLNMLGRDASSFSDRSHFMAYAARAMRGLLIDFVRSRTARKRGGEFHITSLPTEVAETPGEDLELERINEALEQLGGTDRRLAELVDLKFFCGFSFAEIAELMGMSERTAQRDWEKARILLHRYIKSVPPA
jgi:RNA polymerase sigma factor (TIGR02999 family)